jgi:ADP-heptose:LPS heptosyltransferase
MKRALIANFSGLGNGVVAVPLLRALEHLYPTCEYFHTENEVLADCRFARVADLSGLRGFTPSVWRRFAHADWEAIIRFCKERSVDTIVNFRNEGPKFDIGFYEFFEHHADKFEFLVPELPSPGAPQPLVETLRKMIDPICACGCLDHEWLRVADQASRASDEMPEVALFTGASVRQKRWSVAGWVQLGAELFDRGIGTFAIYSGTTSEEVQSFESIVRGLRSARPEVTIRTRPIASLWDLFQNLCLANVVVSNDTVAIHLAAAAGRPVVGLYLCTDPAIWAPIASRVLTCEAAARRHCPRLKGHSGNCGFYGGDTPHPCGAALTTEFVAETVWTQLQGIVSR